MEKLKLLIAGTSFVVLAFFLSFKAFSAPNCKLMNFCGHMCLVCDPYDYVIWDSIYCPPVEDDPSNGD